MLLTYTPDQELLFDHDPAHWDMTASPVVRHASGRTLHLFAFSEHPDEPCIHIIRNAAREVVAVIQVPEVSTEVIDFPAVLQYLGKTFSEAHRRDLQEFVDHITWLLLLQGRTGPHGAFFPQPHIQRFDLSVCGLQDAPVPLVFPDDVQDASRRLCATPTLALRETPGALFSFCGRHHVQNAYIPMPGSAHGLVELRPQLMQTYAWAA